MAFSLDIGRYYNTGSPIHSLDARTKLIGGLVLVICAFLVTNALQLTAAISIAVVVVVLSRVPPLHILASIRPVLLVLVVLALFNLLFVQTGTALVEVGPITITDEGLWASVLYAMRFAFALVVGSLVLLCTTPTQLADAFDRLLSPLSRLGLPGHEIAMVLSLMLRFIPVIADETSSIIDAQSMRGGAFDEGGIVRRVRSVGPVLVALFAGCLRHAESLSRALDARCYEGGSTRTHLHKPCFGHRDAIAALTCIAFVVMIAALA